MPHIKVNGEEVEFDPGMTVIEVIFRDGGNVPHYCWHPALSVVASCRICQVEVSGPGQAPKRLVTACNTACVEGMEVVTETDAVAKARAGNLEGLLLNHPLDCPICDKAGECWLQDYTYEYGAAAGRNDFKRRKLEKRKDISEHVLLDQERCILCTRCVRFMDDYAKKPELIVTERGERSVIDIFPDHPVSSEYQGNLADICPVGALTLKEFRFKNRVWYLTGHDTVCPSCSAGCSITVDVRDNEVNRVRPRTNPAVNGYFICDTGRFGLIDRYHPENRIEGCQVDGEETLVEAASTAAAERLSAIRDDGGDLLVVASNEATNEELFLIQSMFKGSDRVTLAFREVQDTGGDGILKTGIAAANLSGLRALGFEQLSADEIAKRAASVRAMWVMDDGVTGIDGVPELLIVQGVSSPLRLRAHVVFGGSTVGEKEGTLTNGDGVTQRVRPALRHPQGVPGDFRALVEVGQALGTADLPSNPGAAFMAWADSIGRDDLTLAGMDKHGVQLADSAKEMS